jgi:hypothetical protein
MALPQSSIVAGPIEALLSCQFLQEPLKALEVATPITDVVRALAGV